MDGMEPTSEPAPLPVQALPTPPPPSTLHRIFFNEVELRAGWRFLIFLIVLIAVSLSVNFVIRHVRKGPPHSHESSEQMSPVPVILGDGSSLLLLLIPTGVMALIEKRKLRYYGLPLRQALRGNFWWGCVWGFAAISALLLTLRADRNFYFGSPELSGWSIAHFAALWGLAFLMVGLAEEFLLRGYAQFTLTLGMGFWPAAVLMSVLFAALHLNNHGETKFGLFQIVLIGLFFCFTLWRTGTLWFAVGFHASWDWAQSFFYGTPDSGILAQGHLLHSSFAGPDWLTGGTAGPEGSVLVVPLILLLFGLFHFAFPNRAPYPDPEALRPAPIEQRPQTTLGI
jgi:membrane protease YdiL (CAAX protease family)